MGFFSFEHYVAATSLGSSDKKLHYSIICLFGKNLEGAGLSLPLRFPKQILGTQPRVETGGWQEEARGKIFQTGGRNSDGRTVADPALRLGKTDRPASSCILD